jgi:SPASM domain peptide maturase of grasp-with-spasm system
LLRIRKTYCVIWDNLHDEIIDEYFEYLIVNELGFYCDDPDNFPKIDLSWETPEIFTNAIVDLNKESNYDVCKVLKDIEDVGCKNVEFRIFGGYSQADLKDLCLTFKDSIMRYASILVRYDSSFTNEAVKELLEANQRVQRLVIFNSPEELSFDFVSFVKANIESSNCCGSVNYKYFVSNIELFTESQKYNSCLNKKISVDVNGFIKNCPSMSESFGNVENTSFREVSEIETFKKFWKVNRIKLMFAKFVNFVTYVLIVEHLLLIILRNTQNLLNALIILILLLGNNNT